MKLSVVIPVYNTGAYLQRCVDSVLGQNYDDCEIILVDDGSTDGSGALCDAMASADGRIRVIHQANGGLSRARNAGMAAAQGRYILLLDSDDWIEAGCLARFDPLLEHGWDLIMGRARTIDDAGNEKSKLPYNVPCGLYQGRDYLADGLRSERDISFCSPFYLYRTAFVRENALTFCEGILHEDELWTPLALLRAQTVYVSDIFFYYHYVRQGSIMHSASHEKHAMSSLSVSKTLDGVYGGYPKKDVRWLRNRIAMLYLRSIPQLGAEAFRSEMKTTGRAFPLRNSCTARQRAKAVFYFLMPHTYYRLVKKRRHY